MFEVGRLCVKIAGRDAGKKCVVVEVLDRTYVLVDGETRRRKCNIAHLEPMDNVLDIQKGASHESVTAALKKEGLEARSTKPKQAAQKPIAQRVAKESAAATEKKSKAEKKSEAKENKPKKAAAKKKKAE